MTCTDLKETLANYKVITVRYGVFDLSRYSLYSVARETRNSCFDGFVAEGMFRTLDVRNCKVGFYCSQF